MLKRWCDNVYSTSECNYQTFNKIQAKSGFGRAANTNHTKLLKNQSAIKYLP